MQPLPLAIIADEQTPYRLHLHRRICREAPEIELWSLFMHDEAASPWRYRDDREIRSVWFGRGGRWKWSKGGKWLRGGEIVRWLESHGIRAIVLFGYNDAARLRIVRWAAARRIPCFVFGDSNIRCDNATGVKALLKHSYVPWILGKTSGVFHCGRLGREYFLRYGIPPNRLYAFPYEPDYAIFDAPGPGERASARQRYGLPKGRRYLLFTGRMIPAKRPDLLLAAFAASGGKSVAGLRPEWDLVMVGDGPLRGELQNQAKAIGHRIHWLGFVADMAELAAIYAVCDVFVLPSDYEPWGVVLTEAAVSMALVASSAIGAAAEVIENGVNGRIFPASDMAALRTALLEVTDPRNIDRMKAASPAILSRWRRTSDPVQSLRRALQDARLLPIETYAVR